MRLAGSKQIQTMRRLRESMKGDEKENLVWSIDSETAMSTSRITSVRI